MAGNDDFSDGLKVMQDASSNPLAFVGDMIGAGVRDVVSLPGNVVKAIGDAVHPSMKNAPVETAKEAHTPSTPAVAQSVPEHGK